MSPSLPVSDPAAGADALLLDDVDRRYLLRRIGPVRTREVSATLRHLSPPSRRQFMRAMRSVPEHVPAGNALLLAYARLCSAIAELACTPEEGTHP